MTTEGERAVRRVAGTIVAYDDESEHEKLRLRAWAAQVFALEVAAAWGEQERGRCAWGLDFDDVSAIVRWSAWETHGYDLATWLLDADNEAALKVWRNADPAERGNPPGPREPPAPEPKTSELPQFVRDWNRNARRDGDVLAADYLRQCRERAGLPTLKRDEAPR